MFDFRLIPTIGDHTLCQLLGEGVTYTVSFSGHTPLASVVYTHLRTNDGLFMSSEFVGTTDGHNHRIYMDADLTWRTRH